MKTKDWFMILGIILGIFTGCAIEVAKDNPTANSRIVSLILTIARFAPYTIFLFLIVILISAFLLMSAEPEEVEKKSQCRACMFAGLAGCVCAGVIAFI